MEKNQWNVLLLILYFCFFYFVILSILTRVPFHTAIAVEHKEMYMHLSYLPLFIFQPVIEERPLKTNITSPLMKECLLGSQEHKFPEMYLENED